jgi:hypothetical protein
VLQTRQSLRSTEPRESELKNSEHLRSIEHSSPKATEAVSRVNHSVQNLIRNYVSLFKLYAQDGAGIYATQAVKAVGAGIALLMGWNMFVVATIFLVTPAVPLWLSIGFWAVFHIIAGLYVLMNVRGTLRKANEASSRPQPVEPLRTAQVERDPTFFGGGFVP